MPAIQTIVGLIDASLQAGNFSSRKFQISKYFGIADRVKTTAEPIDKIEPMTIDDAGECKKVVYDDNYNFQVFHVVNSIDYKQADPNYGPPGTTIEETANMTLVFVGNRKKLLVRPEQVVAAIAVDMPNEFTFAVLQPLGMNSCVITRNDVELDPYRVWSDQWEGTKSFVKPETILVSVKYTIVSTYNKKCFTLCE